jgi:hypothetical protein
MVTVIIKKKLKEKIVFIFLHEDLDGQEIDEMANEYEAAIKI